MLTHKTRDLAKVDPRAQEHLVRMRDGVRLATDLYLPATGGPFPVILNRTPYDKSHEEICLSQVAAYFNERGYAFVAQDIRGKARSEAEVEAFVHDTADGYDTLEWISRQPWYGGAVAMWGESYVGFTQWAAAASLHPSLKAMVPINTAANIKSWFLRQGVFELLFAAPWAAATFLGRQMIEFDPGEWDWNVRPLRDILTAQFGRSSKSFDAWISATRGSSSGFDRIYGGAVPTDDATIPILHLGGWWDCFREGQLEDWARARAQSPESQILCMRGCDHGGASHPWPTDPTGALLNANQYLIDRPIVIASQLERTHEFFDHVLKGRGNAAAPVRYQFAPDSWAQDVTWPPPGTRPCVLHLNGGERGGALNLRRTSQVKWVKWVHDPENLVPTLGGLPFFTVALPPDDSEVSQRDDVLTFESEPLPADCQILGPVLADLIVGSSAPSLQVVAKLLAIASSNRTRRLCDGARLINRLDSAGEARAVISLGHVACSLRAGDRLALQIACSDYPRFLPHPGTNENPWEATTTAPNQQRLRTGGAHGSRLMFLTNVR